MDKLKNEIKKKVTVNNYNYKAMTLVSLWHQMFYQAIIKVKPIYHSVLVTKLYKLIHNLQ